MIQLSEREYFLGEVCEQIGNRLEKRRREVNSIFASGSRRQAEVRAEQLRQWLKGILKIDFEPCELDAKKTGEIQCGDYVIEKILYQSIPGAYVPANVYRPCNIKEKLPAVLAPVGHFPEGKAHPQFQTYCANLCRNGFIVMTFDPQFQGERAILEDDFSDVLRDDYICVSNHMKAAMPQLLQGEAFAAHYLWDGIRGLDYLCSRTDVDSERIGCSGHSGGGTQTAFITALDDRVKAASVIQYLTSEEEDLLDNGVGEAEQATWGLQARGFDKADLIWMAAPRPIQVNAAVHDNIFPFTGAVRLTYELKELYKLYEASDRVDLATSDSDHELHCHSREAAYYWFNKWLRKKEDFLPEQQVKIFTEEELFCGYREYSKKDAIDWHIEKGKDLRNGRKKREPADAKIALVNFFEGVQREKYQYYPIESLETEEAVGTRFRIHTENSFDVDGIFYRCRRESSKLTVVLDMEHAGTDLPSLLSQGNVLILNLFGSYYYPRKKRGFRFDDQAMVVACIYALGKDLVSIWVNEILCALQHIHLTLENISEIIFETTGQGGVLALIAGLYEEQISEIRTSHMMLTYAPIVEKRHTFINDSDVIYGFLKQFDIPDLLMANAHRRLIIEEPTDEFGEKYEDAVIEEIQKNMTFLSFV